MFMDELGFVADINLNQVMMTVSRSPYQVLDGYNQDGGLNVGIDIDIDREAGLLIVGSEGCALSFIKRPPMLIFHIAKSWDLCYSALVRSLRAVLYGIATFDKEWKRRQQPNTKSVSHDPFIPRKNRKDVTARPSLMFVRQVK